MILISRDSMDWEIQFLQKINKDDKVSSDTAFTQHSTSKMRMFFTVVTSGRFPETLTTIELSPTDLTNIESKLQELEQKYRHILQESRDRLNGPKYKFVDVSQTINVILLPFHM